MTSGPFPVNLRPASTVILLRDSPHGAEVFMVRRHEGTAFMGGAHVFPGGRVDQADHDADDGWCDGIEYAAGQLPGLDRSLAIAYHVAAARELFEEAGILLARDQSGRQPDLSGPDARSRIARSRVEVHDATVPLRAIIEREGLRLALDGLILFAHWVTPPVDTRQFDTRFFVTRVPPHQVPAHDDTETTHSSWLTPAGAIAQSLRGDIVLPPPTWTTLRELERFGSVDQALAGARTRRISRRQPKMLEEGGRRMLVLPGDPRYLEATDFERPAETCFVLVDRRWRPEPPRT